MFYCSLFMSSLSNMLAVSFLFVLFGVFCSTEQATVKVSVFYETLCPDSKRFIIDQFYPTYKEIGQQYVDVDFVPYGHASESNRSGILSFTCQHGPRECFGNLYHSCALALNTNKVATSNFIHCSMTDDPSSEESLEKCAKSAGLSWEPIYNCKNDIKRSSQYLHENGEKTRAVEDTSFIPTIVLNDKFDATNQQRALSNFKRLICEYLRNEPRICTQ